MTNYELHYMPSSDSPTIAHDEPYIAGRIEALNDHYQRLLSEKKRVETILQQLHFLPVEDTSGKDLTH